MKLNREFEGVNNSIRLSSEQLDSLKELGMYSPGFKTEIGIVPTRNPVGHRSVNIKWKSLIKI